MPSASGEQNRVDVFSPGRITSARIQTGKNGSNAISGASIAAPRVASLALTFTAKDPASYSRPASITAGTTFFATHKRGILPPVSAGTTTLIAYFGL